IGFEGLTLFFGFDPREGSDFASTVAELDRMAWRLGEIEIDNHCLVCWVRYTDEQDPVTLVKIAAELRRHGIRFAVDDFGIGPTNMDRIELLRPDVVRVDGRRFRRLAAVAGAATLFRSLVAGLRERGAKVLVDGIDTPAQLEYAL